MLVAADLNPPDDMDAFFESFWAKIAELDEPEGRATVEKRSREFSEARVRGVLGKREEIDGVLASLLDNWDLYRLGTVERAVLRMGVWELDSTDIPAPVVINEAIDLVNWFSGPKSRSLVNGILDKHAKAPK